MAKEFNTCPTYSFLAYILAHLGEPICPFYFSPKDMFTVSWKTQNPSSVMLTCEHERIALSVEVILPFWNTPASREYDHCRTRLKAFHKALNELCGQAVNAIYLNAEDERRIANEIRDGLRLPNIKDL